MNAFLRKEIRLIAPAWIVAMILGIFPVWLVWPLGDQHYFLAAPGMTVFAPFGIGVLLLGLASFGQELNFDTFSLLLALPLPRRRIWRVKTCLLGAALGLVFIALCVSNYFRVESVIERLTATDWRNVMIGPTVRTQMLQWIAETRHAAFHDSLVIGGLGVLAAFSSGLWTNLLFRNTSAAFWFSLLVPLGLGLLASKLFVSSSPASGLADAGLIIALGVYSAAGFFWAKKFFLRVEDNQWTGGLLSFPAWFGAKTDTADRRAGLPRKPFRALIQKEVQLHQVNLFIAFLLMLTHIVDLVVRRVSMQYFVEHRGAAMIWESWPLLWLVMPLLIGGVAVAEERKLGTLEGFLCLPTTRRREFLVKFAVAMALSFVLGGLLPLALEWCGVKAGLSRNIFDMTMTYDWKTVSLVAQLLAGSCVLGAVAFYASTLTRNLLQALGLSVVLNLFLFFVIALVAGIANGQILRDTGVPLWSGPLVVFVGIPVMTLTVLALAFKNFKHLYVSGKLWARNSILILGTLFFTFSAISLIYHRVWEIWLPIEPVHRFMRDTRDFIVEARPGDTNSLHENFGPLKMDSSLARLAIVLPDHRLWLRRRRDEAPIISFWKTGSWQDGFVEGAIWRNIAVTDRKAFAIQTNGTLWDLSTLEPGKVNRGAIAGPFDQGNDWKTIAGVRGEERFLALKQDGTLWEWGTELLPDKDLSFIHEIPTPTQIGIETNWIAIAGAGILNIAVKADGSVWRWGVEFIHKTEKTWTPRYNNIPKHWLDFPAQKPVALSLRPNALAAITEDGSLWVGGRLRDAFLDETTRALATNQMVHLTQGTNWTEAKWTDSGALIAVSRRSLWQWDTQAFWRRHNLVEIPPIVPSKYLDWVAISPYGDAFYALASNGQITCWGDPDPNQYYYTEYGIITRGWLMPSRIEARTVATMLE